MKFHLLTALSVQDFTFNGNFAVLSAYQVQMHKLVDVISHLWGGHFCNPLSDRKFTVLP